MLVTIRNYLSFGVYVCYYASTCVRVHKCTPIWIRILIYVTHVNCCIRQTSHYLMLLLYWTYSIKLNTSPPFRWTEQGWLRDTIKALRQHHIFKFRKVSLFRSNSTEMLGLSSDKVPEKFTLPSPDLYSIISDRFTFVEA